MPQLAMTMMMMTVTPLKQTERMTIQRWIFADHQPPSTTKGSTLPLALLTPLESEFMEWDMHCRKSSDSWPIWALFQNA
jgi:hypothetical protein